MLCLEVVSAPDRNQLFKRVQKENVIFIGKQNNRCIANTMYSIFCKEKKKAEELIGLKKKTRK